MPKKRKNLSFFEDRQQWRLYGSVFFVGVLFGVFLQEIDRSPSIPLTSESNINVCFSPEGRCENVAVKAIQSAQEEILVQCYSFTSKPISDALIRAHHNGIKVRVLFDRSQLKAPYSRIHQLSNAGIETTVDYVSGIAHNKIILIDNSRVLTGSYNFSKAANNKNAENMLLITDETLAKTYKQKWNQRFQKAKERKRHD